MPVTMPLKFAQTIRIQLVILARLQQSVLTAKTTSLRASFQTTPFG